jgi:hypothetical protein
MAPRDQQSYQLSTMTHPVPTRPPAIGAADVNSRSWLGGRRAARALRRAEAGRQRVVHRVEMLGPQWHIVDYNLDDPDFLAIGPAGIFQVTVCDHGRARVQLGGDVVQVNGVRIPYVSLARRDARRISQQLSQMVGRSIPVIPVVAFLGNGPIVYYGRPPEGCVVTTYRDVGKALNAHGRRLAAHTASKLAILARRVDSNSVGQYNGAVAASG